MSESRPVGIVTGSSRGVGAATVKLLAKNGYNVVVNYSQSEKEAREVQAACKSLGAETLLCKADVSEDGDCRRMVDEAIAKWGRIDVLVNNAGVAPKVRMDILETTAESFDRLLSINMRGAFFLTQKVAKEMIAGLKNDPKSRPSILFISSISASVSSTSRAEYCVSKAALSMAAKIYADRLAEFGINVYEIRPGIIKTNMTAAVREKYDRLIAEGLVPQKRWGFPEDVGKAVAALAQGYFPYSTGLILEVSGGMNIRRL